MSDLYGTLANLAGNGTGTLTEVYRPRTIDEFVGLEKPKRICNRLASNPRACSLLFVGPSGTGKTTMARALAETMRAELHYIPSQECNLENLNRIVSICHYKPMSGCKMSLVLIDEADQMSKAAQISLLSTLDNPPPDTIFIFTCNETGRLEDRFLSRVMTVEFSSYGIAREAVTMLGRIWKIEAQGAPEPNFARIVKETNNNIRASLMKLQTELMLA